MTKMLLFFEIQAFFPLTFKNHKTAREKGDKFFLYSNTSTHFLGTQTLTGRLLKRTHLCTQLPDLSQEPSDSGCKSRSTKLCTPFISNNSKSSMKIITLSSQLVIPDQIIHSDHLIICRFPLRGMLIFIFMFSLFVSLVSRYSRTSEKKSEPTRRQCYIILCIFDSLISYF